MNTKFRNPGLYRSDKFARKHDHEPTKFIKNKNFQSRLKNWLLLFSILLLPQKMIFCVETNTLTTFLSRKARSKTGFLNGAL